MALIAEVDLATVGQEMAVGTAMNLMTGTATVHDGHIMGIEKGSGIFRMAVGAGGTASLFLHAPIL